VSRLRPRLDRAAAAAATLTGKRFGLLVASSLVATAAIVAGALTGTGGSGALAALLGRSLASPAAPVAATPPVAAAPGRSGSAAPPTPAAAGAGSSSAPLATPSGPAPAAPRKAPRAEPPPAPPALPEAGRVKHVFVISLTSPGYEAAFGETSQMPYLAGQLRPKGELLSGYALLDDAGPPNDVAAISGQPPNASSQGGCTIYAEFPPSAEVDGRGVVSGSGCVYPVETLTIADQLSSSRFSWHAYVDGMVDATGKPANCVHPEPGAVDAPVPGGYAAARNPFVYFHSLLDLGDCAGDDVPIEQLTAALRRAEKTPSYSYITPTPCDSGAVGQCPPRSPEGAAAADAFLAKWAPPILASPAYREGGLLIVAFDASGAPTPADAPPPGEDPHRVGALLLSRFLSGGATDATSFGPYSLLRSTEDLFGLSHLGLAGGAKVASFAPALLGETSGD
jgi:phosphatidylinositol-3-phosphatase